MNPTGSIKVPEWGEWIGMPIALHVETGAWLEGYGSGRSLGKVEESGEGSGREER